MSEEGYGGYLERTPGGQRCARQAPRPAGPHQYGPRILKRRQEKWESTTSEIGWLAAWAWRACSASIVAVALAPATWAESPPLLLGVFPRYNATETTTRYTPLAESPRASGSTGRSSWTPPGTFDLFWRGVEERRYDIVQYNQYHYIRSAKTYQVIAHNKEFGKSTVAGALYVRKDSGITEPRAAARAHCHVRRRRGRDDQLHRAGLSDAAGRIERRRFQDRSSRLTPLNSVIALYHKQADAAGGGDIRRRAAGGQERHQHRGADAARGLPSSCFILPWAVKRTMPPKLRESIRSHLVELETSEAGRNVLKAAMLTGIGNAEDKDYDAHRKMVRVGDGTPAGMRSVASARSHALPTLAALAVIIAFVLWAHFGSGVPVFQPEVVSEPGWEKFRAEYGIDYFGNDGQFVRAVQNGYNLVFHTHKYASRFTRKARRRPAEFLRRLPYVPKISPTASSTRTASMPGSASGFRSRTACAGAMPRSVDGFVPTVYDPAVRDHPPPRPRGGASPATERRSAHEEGLTALCRSLPESSPRSPCCCSCSAGFISSRSTSTRERERMRDASVALTPDCAEKLSRYALAPGEQLRVALRGATDRHGDRASRLQRGGRARHPARLQHRRRHAGPSRAGPCAASAGMRSASSAAHTRPAITATGASATSRTRPATG